MDAVVCHGDACNPNFLLDQTGHCVGYVDLGRLGVGDRWADLAPALLSLGWNFGEGWEPAFLDGYGIERDAAKQEFYTWVWNAI
jgi:kanamycin kinase